MSSTVSRLTRTPRTEPLRIADRWLLSRLRRALGEAPLRFVVGGTVLDLGPDPPVATVLFRNRRTLLRVLWDLELRFGEAFSEGALEVEGDLVAFLEAVNRALAQTRRPRRRPSLASRLTHGLRASRHNVRRHYDLGNDFYRLWLDERMVYTCAYFTDPQLGLEEAQVAKMDRVCRKLGLRPGQSVVEAGCGWGALALHMAERYGVSVKAYNVSPAQIAWAREHARERGLQGRVEFVEEDYRKIQGRFDVFVSVGMLEHVGLANYGVLSAVIDRSLKPGGRGLLHFIGRDQPRPLNAWIRKHVFPGAYPPTLSQAIERVLVPAGLSVIDVENLRLHYAKTLEHWRARFEASMKQVASRFGEAFARTWRLYLAGSQASFTTGWLQLFQVVFARPGDNEIPWTRAAWD